MLTILTLLASPALILTAAVPAPSSTISPTPDQPWYFPGSLPVLNLTYKGAYEPLAGLVVGYNACEPYMSPERNPDNHPMAAVLPWYCFDLVNGTEAYTSVYDDNEQAHPSPNATTTDGLCKYHDYVRKLVAVFEYYEDRAPQVYNYFSSLYNATIRRLNGYTCPPLKILV